MSTFLSPRPTFNCCQVGTRNQVTGQVQHVVVNDNCKFTTAAAAAATRALSDMSHVWHNGTESTELTVYTVYLCGFYMTEMAMKI